MNIQKYILTTTLLLAAVSSNAATSSIIKKGIYNITFINDSNVTIDKVKSAEFKVSCSKTAKKIIGDVNSLNKSDFQAAEIEQGLSVVSIKLDRDMAMSSNNVPFILFGKDDGCKSQLELGLLITKTNGQTANASLFLSAENLGNKNIVEPVTLNLMVSNLAVEEQCRPIFKLNSTDFKTQFTDHLTPNEAWVGGGNYCN